MSHEIILIVALVLPVLTFLVLRANAAMVFLSVCLGAVLVDHASGSIKTPELLTKRNVAEKIIEYIEQNAKQRHKKDRVGA